MAGVHVVGLHVNIGQLRLVDLPTDALLCIFKFCDEVSLRNLSLTCKRLNNVASEDCLWIKESNSNIITNQLSNEIKERCFTQFTAKERCRIAVNWKHGCYVEKMYNTNMKYMPWLFLESDMLWISRGKTIIGVQRLQDHIEIKKPRYFSPPSHIEDISRFVKVNDIIYSGGKDMLICGWSPNSDRLLFCQQSNHGQDIQGIDCKRNILVSGSKDRTFKVWQVVESESSLKCTQTVQVCDRVWSVAIDPSLSCIAAGSAGYNGVHPLSLYDLERGEEKPIKKILSRNGAAVFDILWESPSCLITCGFDTVTRLWDTRVGDCVSCWSDPFGAAGYCLASDRNFSVICGTAHHGRAQLWDKRIPSSVQAFFGRGEASSPVYSISFDVNQLFIAQDSCVNLLDFTYHSSKNRHADFSYYWR